MWRGGRKALVEPSQERIQRRKAIDSILRKDHMFYTSKIDDVIDYMKAQYDGPAHQGFTKEFRRNLFVNRGGACMWCKKPLTIGAFTVEHIRPQVEGGTDDEENLGIACPKCNNGRDGEVFTASGYLIEALRRYNPRFAVDNGVDSTASAEVQ